MIPSPVEGRIMFENRISELYQFTTMEPNMLLRGAAANILPSVPAATTAAHLLPVVSTQDIYQMAAAKSRYDHELDKLFNPEYYGDQGSGI